MPRSTEEFPLLRAHGLYAADIRGDGNCLFNALSDQLYGTQSRHHEIRARVIEYMRDHAPYYKQFMDVRPGGGARRNPKRKNAGAYASPEQMAPTPEEVERVFESHLQTMARGGTYGDNMEISAFSSAYDVDVKIYQRDFAYMVSGGDPDNEEESEGPRRIVHIAYHVWEHYSSIRNIEGPHTGPPQVKEQAISSEEQALQQERLAKTSRVHPWMIDVVLSSLPYLADRALVKRTLEECRGNVDDAVSKLLDLDERQSNSSTPGSSSIERDPDSDDEASSGPNKKQDRRLSRATRATLRQGRQPNSYRRDAFASRDSTPSSEASSRLGVRGVNAEVKSSDGDATEDEDWRPDYLRDDDSASDYSSTSRSQPRSGVKLTLRPPKQPSSVAPLTQSNGTNGTTINKTVAKPHAVPGPRKRTTARERKDMKKAAQKAAAKERRIAAATGGKQGRPGSANGGVPLPKDTTSGQKKAGSPVIEVGIKTLYI
ncbi:OTU-domain-containing protein [Xylona heveae TC161]|uniref:OTU-domain-containing protein n=1 Tax=Xylona heveae (strain CBS 132557 / TC161) TaxID=1328760 RepID=A0A165HAB2_XYLHT|nr:OTU-domain-containing protein [Xylona heveae TC161]KZF23206.1 OTU-domain-containing protein [Xylona heveae TC161]